MKITEIISQVSVSIEITIDKSELKLKKRLLGLLNELLEKDLTTKQGNLLDEKLYYLFNKIDFKDINKKDLKKRFDELIQFLNNKLFLFTDGHYSGIGFLIGTIFGLFFQSFSLTLIRGSYFNIYSGFFFMFIGIVIGAIVDSQIKKQGRTLKTTLY